MQKEFLVQWDGFNGVYYCELDNGDTIGEDTLGGILVHISKLVHHVIPEELHTVEEYRNNLESSRSIKIFFNFSY